MTFLLHEQIYRSVTIMEKIREFSVTICGAGALGANMTENLARSGFGRLKVIDCDRIEERNLATQPYYRSDVGAFKAKILSHQLYRALNTKINISTVRLTPETVQQLLTDTQVVIDTFDNSLSRQVVSDYCSSLHLPCLHIGLAGDYAEVIWNEVYQVPSPAFDDICDYPLARNLVLLAVATACETLIHFIAAGEKNHFTITLKDLQIRPYSG